jgi:Family of unknown function (DUF6441)
MPLRFSMTDVAEAWSKSIAAEQARMTRAATAAIHAAGEQGKGAGRASIAGAGFSAKWQNALRVKYYPPSGDSLSPAAFIYHKIDYANVFEEGATIAGKPYLWIAISGAVPPSSGRSDHPMTPAEYQERIGPLVAVEVAGRPPMLFDKYVRVGDRRSRRAQRAGDQRKPLYVGVPAVDIAKRFDIAGAAKHAADDLPQLYEQAMGAGS